MFASAPTFVLLLGGACVEMFALLEASALGYQVYAADYRNPPDHPYPAALDDWTSTASG
jgi:acetyl esterase/lipase